MSDYTPAMEDVRGALARVVTSVWGAGVPSPLAVAETVIAAGWHRDDAEHDREVAAAEREACAEIADDEWETLADLGEWSDGAQVASMNIARRIRARGEGGSEND